MGETDVMELPPGVPDPLFLHELALKMGKSIREMVSGEPGMSAHELCVLWPHYFLTQAQIREAEEQRAGQ